MIKPRKTKTNNEKVTKTHEKLITSKKNEAKAEEEA